MALNNTNGGPWLYGSHGGINVRWRVSTYPTRYIGNYQFKQNVIVYHRPPPRSTQLNLGKKVSPIVRLIKYWTRPQRAAISEILFEKLIFFRDRRWREGFW